MHHFVSYIYPDINLSPVSIIKFLTLVWDDIKRAKFNFYWWDATTFFPYQAETAYESSLMVQQSGALALSSLQSVFLSLTSNARAIYLILVKYQLNNSSHNFTGNYCSIYYLITQ